MYQASFSTRLDDMPRRDVAGLGGDETETARVSRLALIGQIAIGVAHEIISPLTVSKGYLQFLENKSPHCMREALGIVFQELGRIEAVTTNFIALAGNKPVEKTPKNLNHILQQFYPTIQAHAARHNIATELFLDKNLPMLNLDVAEIKQLVMNLAYNGIEAMSNNRRLTIGTISEFSRVILYVRDEGSGIPKEQMEKIFDPFYTTKTGSTGLGLAIGLNIIKRHQGQIKLVSDVGAGTTFSILFPVLDR